MSLWEWNTCDLGERNTCDRVENSIDGKIFVEVDKRIKVASHDVTKSDNWWLYVMCDTEVTVLRNKTCLNSMNECDVTKS